jgi:multiple sugar transport system permease protein
METTSTATQTVAVSSHRALRLNILMWILLIPLAIATIMPIVYMVSLAFSPENETMVWPIHWIPNHPTISNFTRILQDPTLPVLRWFVNSMFVSISITALVLFLSSLAAYAYARLEFPGRNFLFFVLIFSLMIPAAVTLIPAFLLLRDLKMLDSYNALIWPAGAGVGGIFLLRQHFFSIPRELEEAAVVDGANRFWVYWRVCLPLVQGALITQGIFTFLGAWNDLFWPLIVLSDRVNLTLPVGLLILNQGTYVQRGLAMAGGVLASVAPIILYIVFQRQIVRGIATTGLGGH